MRDVSVTLEVHPRGDIRPEMPSEVRGLEGNQIRGKNTTQEMLPNGEATEDLRRWEGHMEEEPDWSIWKCLANHLWDEHQMIIVNPNWKACEYGKKKKKDE